MSSAQPDRSSARRYMLLAVKIAVSRSGLAPSRRGTDLADLALGGVFRRRGGVGARAARARRFRPAAATPDGLSSRVGGRPDREPDHRAGALPRSTARARRLLRRRAV